MKLKKISSGVFFDPEKIVSNSDIFSRKSEFIDLGDRREEQKTFSDDGLFSKRIFGDLNTSSEYSCECEKYTGKVNEGLVCDVCNSEVKLQEANIDKIGWIDLKEVYVIKYISYMLLEKVIGRENLKSIIHIPNTITIDGDLEKTEIEQIQKSSSEHKYWHIGIQEFKDKYQEVLKYYFELHNRKEEAIYKFLEDSEDIFTSKIPVISTVLRPAMRTDEGLKLDAINNIYINILKNVEILNDKIELIQIVKDLTVEAIQAQYFQLSQEIMDNIKSKGGLIRNQIMGRVAHVKLS
jgi:hypothetical protein